MGGQGHNRACDLYARWSRIEAARRDLEDDAKAIFAEAREEGFRPKTLRAAFREQYAEEHEDAEKLAARQEDREEIDLLRAQIAGASHARVREAKPFFAESAKNPPHGPDTGETTEKEDAPSSSNRDASTGGKPSLTAGSGGQAVPGSQNGRPPGHEGHQREGAGKRTGAGLGNTAEDPAPATSEPDMPAWMRRTDRGAMAEAS